MANSSQVQPDPQGLAYSINKGLWGRMKEGTGTLVVNDISALTSAEQLSPENRP